MFPEVSRQWHPTKNGKLDPEQMTAGSGKKVWWKCEKGHEWQANIYSRTRPNGTGCPYCSGRMPTHDYNLQVINPRVARQWHPTRNGNLNPEQITPSSSKKVWWICEKSHEWRTTIKARNKGANCPYCTSRLIIKETSLLAVNPELAKQWHPTKNGDLSPENIAPKSGKKVWWICDKGHEWQAEVASRSLGAGCPYCYRESKRATKDYNLSVVNPRVAAQWHPVKNGNLTPSDVTPGINKKVWWVCKDGHEWQSSVRTRNNGVGCPYCSGKKTAPEKSLAALKPALANQWHPIKNGTLHPSDVTTGSGKRVWWKCEKGHEWEAVINDRCRGGSCPYCQNRLPSSENKLILVNPILSKEWHPTRNGKLTPSDVAPKSNKRVWWQCKNGHEWEAAVVSRSNGSQCPYCSGKKPRKDNNLSILSPGLAREWHPTKNGKLTPFEVLSNSRKKVWWRCKNGHEWQAIIQNRSRGNNCPYCIGRKASKEYNLGVVNPGLIKEWHPTKNGKLTPFDVTPNSHKKAWWLCKNGHEWQAVIGNRNKGIGCRFCKKPGLLKKHFEPRVQYNKNYTYVLTTLDEKKKIKMGNKTYFRSKTVPYARFVYGLENIPPGYIIWHKDGDPVNNDLDNLECISRSEAMKRLISSGILKIFTPVKIKSK
jgi:DNA-directed RNA polymerase subunit RPC12/RpoP